MIKKFVIETTEEEEIVEGDYSKLLIILENLIQR
jgi:hypothetical protein